jgi:hypothetical protein
MMIFAVDLTQATNVRESADRAMTETAPGLGGVNGPGSAGTRGRSSRIFQSSLPRFADVLGVIPDRFSAGDFVWRCRYSRIRI